MENGARLVETPVGSFEALRSVEARTRGGRFREAFHFRFDALVDVLLAVLAPIARVAFAEVVLDEIDALRAVEARGVETVVHVDLAMVSRETRVVAVAAVRIDAVDAEAFVEAGRRLALVNVDLAARPGEAGHADASEGGDAVDAGAVVLARRRFALVDVDVAILAGESRSAHALVAVDEVVARPVVPARMRQTLVKLQVAVVAGKARPAVALIRSCARKKRLN